MSKILYYPVSNNCNLCLNQIELLCNRSVTNILGRRKVVIKNSDQESEQVSD